MFGSRKEIDFLSIGDITVDAFIKIKDADIHCEYKKEKCELCFNFGGKVPYESVTEIPGSGNGPNVSVGISRLGFSSALISATGEDDNGKKCIETLKREKVWTENVTIQKDKNTNYHFVLWYGVERTILTKHNDFTYRLPKNLPVPGWLYLSSIGDSSSIFYKEITSFLEKNPGVRLAFQPGTFQLKMETEKLRNIYKRTDVFICNKQEAERLLQNNTKEIKKLLWGVKTLGPKVVVITDGIYGAYAYDGETNWFMPTYPQEPFERTGAGDAFSSAFIGALMMGKTIEEALMWGPINSASVVKYAGAQKGLLTRKQIEEHLKKAPESYHPRKI